jgi:hypothetical protein
VNLKILGIDFLADLIVLKSWGIDVILGMDWLDKHDGIILCRKRSVVMTSPQGERIEFIVDAPIKRTRDNEYGTREDLGGNKGCK